VAANSAANAEFSLLSELTAFHASTSEGETTVTLAMHFELMENRTRQTRCTHEETLEIRADNTRLPSLMTAFSKGSHQLSESMVSWAHDCLAGTVKMK
jgi:cholesterol transport system auxiliary component